MYGYPRCPARNENNAPRAPKTNFKIAKVLINSPPKYLV